MDPVAQELDLSIVIPVYNSEGVVGETVDQTVAVCESAGLDFELILVNDGSRDSSWPVVLELASTHTWVRGINLMRNFGQHIALLCGVRAARNDVICTGSCRKHSDCAISVL